MIREYRDKKKGNFYQSMMAGFAVLMGIAVWVLGGAYKAEKLLAIPETVTLAKITKDGDTIKVTDDALMELRQSIIDLEVREWGIEDVNKYEGIKIQFYENDRETIWFRIIDEEAIWDYSEPDFENLVL